MDLQRLIILLANFFAHRNGMQQHKNDVSRLQNDSSSSPPLDCSTVFIDLDRWQNSPATRGPAQARLGIGRLEHVRFIGADAFRPLASTHAGGIIAPFGLLSRYSSRAYR